MMMTILAVLISLFFVWFVRAKRLPSWSLAVLTTAGILTVAVGGEAAANIFWLTILFLLVKPLFGFLKLF